MAEAKLAPNLPDWMLEHANRYLSSGGTDGHLYKVAVPQRGEITAPALLLTTTGRKSGNKFIFPLFYGTDGGSYFVIASKGGAPQHPGWYRNILANPDVEIQVGTQEGERRALMDWIQRDHRYLALGLELIVGVGRPKFERLLPKSEAFLARRCPGPRVHLLGPDLYFDVGVRQNIAIPPWVLGRASL